MTTGAIRPQTTWGNNNNYIFAVRQAMAKLQTATLVQIEACTNEGDLSPVGFVDVTPLVNQVDGAGNPTPHVTIYNLPYLRVQGGSNAVIIDPEPGDIGVAVFASRDISKVKSTKDQANPGSLRQYDFADGLYLGGMLNDEPEQYVQLNSDGLKIVSPNTITLQAPNIVLDGAVTQSGGDVTMSQNLAVSGKATVAGDVTATGTSLHTHKHISAASGSPTSPPI